MKVPSFQVKGGCKEEKQETELTTPLACQMRTVEIKIKPKQEKAECWSVYTPFLRFVGTMVLGSWDILG